MKDSEAYLRAAELVDSGKERFSCWAIARAISPRCDDYWGTPLAVSYANDLGFRTGDVVKYGWDDYARRNIRVWMLCLASAIAESDWHAESGDRYGRFSHLHP